jgi:hypothetical protein
MAVTPSADGWRAARALTSTISCCSGRTPAC